MKVYSTKIALALTFLISLLNMSANAAQTQPNIIEPMCKKGKFSIFKKSTQTFRSYEGELCKIVPIAKWVLRNCKDQDEDFKISDCKLNAQFALKNITPQQNLFQSDMVRIDDPQDASDLMELAKIQNVLTAKDINIWQKYSILFPKPSPKPFLHFKQ